ncbi:MAG: pyrimidine 5'-nucleotidase [Burkholderiaceae bacterium]|nr:pyrimidine 5'-nucleotidase [Burkholderiaceae bacterium]
MSPLRSTLALHRPRRARASSDGQAETVWLFDLDNTLHDASHAIFGAINSAMTQAVASTLDLDLAAASTLRTRYWQRYGATVIGMVRHHHADPHEFLRLSHDFNVAELVRAEPGLGRKLQALPGRKILFTNAPADYARQVLKTLRLLPHFEAIYSINDMSLQGRIRPKPSLALMHQVLARLKTPAHRVVLVEDTLKNLKTARQAGMRTVHIYHPGTPFASARQGRNSYVDLRFKAVENLLVRRHALRTPDRLDHV